MPMTPRQLLLRSPVMPVLAIHQPADAGALAQALVRGGLPVLQVTMRTPGAQAAIREMRRTAPDALVGAADLADGRDFDAAVQAGAQFGLTPGFTPQLAAAAAHSGLPLLPGVLTPADILAARGAGYDAFVLFPAQPMGGTALLQALAEPFPGALFCAAGGITRHNAHEYLASPGVACVAATWIAPRDAVDARDWITIEALARDAARLHRPVS